MISPDPFVVDAAVAALLPPEDAAKVTPKTPCITCKGRGVYDSYPLDNKGPSMEFECYKCDGKSWV